MASIPLLYRLFCLWIEPVLAIGGTYLCYFDQARFIQGTTPVLIGRANTALSPLNKLLLTEISGLYAFLALNEALVLRLSNDPNIWRAVEFSMCFSDLAHLWAIYEGSPAEFVDVLRWRGEDWINIGSLFVGLAIRVAVVLGVGFGSGQEKKKATGKQQ